jgi:hypothetical protein
MILKVLNFSLSNKFGQLKSSKTFSTNYKNFLNKILINNKYKKWI